MQWMPRIAVQHPICHTVRVPTSYNLPAIRELTLVRYDSGGDLPQPIEQSTGKGVLTVNVMLDFFASVVISAFLWIV